MTEITYSQIGQDLFVKNTLKNKIGGLFLDIGGGPPKFINNTYLLEKQYGWNGISIDMSQEYCKMWKDSDRNTKFILGDATTIDYNIILSEFQDVYGTNRIDYLSMDLEPPIFTLNALLKIPFDEFKFSVITYETDMYRDPIINGEGIDKLYTSIKSREVF